MIYAAIFFFFSNFEQISDDASSAQKWLKAGGSCSFFTSKT